MYAYCIPGRKSLRASDVCRTAPNPTDGGCCEPGVDAGTLTHGMSARMFPPDFAVKIIQMRSLFRIRLVYPESKSETCIWIIRYCFVRILCVSESAAKFAGAPSSNIFKHLIRCIAGPDTKLQRQIKIQLLPRFCW